jgi:hypothetical protein
MPLSQTLRPMQRQSFNPEGGRSIIPSFRSPLSRAIAIVTAVTITAHLAFIGLPSINFEWAFVDAARYFGLHQSELLVRYFGVEANPLGVPLLSYFVHLILPFLKIDIIPRLLAISGFAFLAFALLRIGERVGITLSAPLLTAIIFLNPLIWTFGGRGTADFFPAALALCAVALFWDAPDTARRRILAVVLFGLAIIMKYHAVLLLPLVWLEELSRPGANHKNAFVRLCTMSCAILLGPAIYLVVVKRSLGFWLAPPLFQGVHHLSLTPTFVITNFVCYSGYVGLLLIPFSFLPLWKHAHSRSGIVRIVVAGLLLFILGFFVVVPNGEMNFGPLDVYLTPCIVGGCFALCAGLLPLCIADGIQSERANPSNRRYMICLAAGIFLFIGVLSFTRPAQRYLLFVLPLAYCFVARALVGRRLMAAFVIVVSITSNAFIYANQLAKGQASAEMMRQISEDGYVPLTEPGALLLQDGDQFPLQYNAPARYIVISGKAADAIVVVEKRPFPFVHKAYSLVLESSPSNRAQ